jgi:hypothetical protein
VFKNSRISQADCNKTISGGSRMSSTATKTEFSNVSAGKAQFQVFDFSKEESEVAANRKTEMLRQADGPKESSNQASIPSELRGYVSVAVSTGLLKGDSTFRPQDALTRGDLAHAIAVLQTRAIQ